ncbi:MAG: chemotaxis protein CheW, partial [Stellaceae bacterium]
RQFAAAPDAATVPGERFLVVGVGGEILLLRLSQIAGLFADRRIVPMPRAGAFLLGITGLRGAILPVYSLAASLGYPPPTVPPRWTVTMADAALAFAFDRFDRHIEVPRDRIVPRADADRGRGHLREAAPVGRDNLSIVDLPSVAAQL